MVIFLLLLFALLTSFYCNFFKQSFFSLVVFVFIFLAIKFTFGSKLFCIVFWGLSLINTGWYAEPFTCTLVFNRPLLVSVFFPK